MGGLCSGKPNNNKNKQIKREKIQEREQRKKQVEENRESHPHISLRKNSNISQSNLNQNNINNNIPNNIDIQSNINIEQLPINGVGMNHNNISNSNTIRSNLNNLERNSNNMINISINDELSSRRNNGNLISNLLINSNNMTMNNRGENGQIQLYCSRCNFSFGNRFEYETHRNTCGDSRNNQMMNNINEILLLVQSLNRHLQNEVRFNPHSLLGFDEPEDALDFIDWKFHPELNYWKNEGKINITVEELKKISSTEIIKVKHLKFWQKRIWFLNYINKNVYDKSSDNTTLVVSRNNILEESFNQFMTTHDLDLKKSMQIFFVDEQAIDIGGVYREWYSILFEEIFSEKNEFFKRVIESDKGKNTYFLPTSQNKIHINSLEYFEFIGKIMGKALFDKIIIKGTFNLVLLKLIMNKSVGLEDIEFLDEGIYHSLKQILQAPLKDSDLNFTWNYRKNDQLESIELIEGGTNIILDDTNKHFFVNKVIEFMTYLSIKDKLEALKYGFYSIIPHEIIETFEYFELDYLFSGQCEIDILDWKANTIYRGKYSEDHPVIKDFWEILGELTKDDLLLFYKFCTGCTRVPIDGFVSLQGTRNKFQKFCIESPNSSQGDSLNRLIEANTCFNRIYLPEYNSKEKIRKIIKKILENDTNYFGKQ